MSVDPSTPTPVNVELQNLRARVAELESRLTERTAQFDALKADLHEAVHQRQQADEVLHRLEHRYQVTFENAGDALFMLSLSGQFLEANPAACEQLGYPLIELLPKNLLEVVTVEHREPLHQYLGRLPQHTELAFETAFQRRDGSVLLAEMNSRVIDYGGQPVIFCIARDITERKRTEMWLLQTEKMSALGRLVSSIAHEINNPLQAVQGCLMLAQREVEEGLIVTPDRAEALLKDLDVATTEVARIARLVERLHDFYRPARPGVQPIEADAAIEAVLALVARQLWYGNVTVVHDGASQPIQLKTNADQLKQVLLNLTLNSLDAMPQGGTLSISAHLDTLRRDDRIQPAVRIDLSDTGHGISPEHLPRIFEPFFTTKEQGSGLGLSISYELIKTLGGEMSVTSEVGTGTTFTIRLPLELEGSPL